MPIDKSNGMSPELIKDLAKALEDADRLMKEQEKALARILEAESKIMSKRAESLDEYTEGLNRLTKQYEKDLDGYFSALENRLTELYKKAPSNPNMDNPPSSGGSKKQGSSSSDTSMRGVPKAVKEIRDILRRETINVSDAKQHQLLTEFLSKVISFTGKSTESSTNSDPATPANVSRYIENSGNNQEPAQPNNSENITPPSPVVQSQPVEFEIAQEEGYFEVIKPEGEIKSIKKLETERIKSLRTIQEISLKNIENELEVQRKAMQELEEGKATALAESARLTDQFKLKAKQQELSDIKKINEARQKIEFDASEDGIKIKEAALSRELEIKQLQYQQERADFEFNTKKEVELKKLQHQQEKDLFEATTKKEIELKKLQYQQEKDLFEDNLNKEVELKKLALQQERDLEDDNRRKQLELDKAVEEDKLERRLATWRKEEEAKVKAQFSEDNLDPNREEKLAQALADIATLEEEKRRKGLERIKNESAETMQFYKELSERTQKDTEALNKLRQESAYYSSDEGVELATEGTNKAIELKAAQEIAQRKAKWEAEEILKAQLANNGKLTKEDLARIKKTSSERFKLDSTNIDKISKEQQKADKKRLEAEAKERKAKGDAAVKDSLFGPDKSLVERIQGLKDLRKDMTGATDGNGNAMSKGAANLALAAKAATDLLEKLEGQITSIASYKGEIDTRLQGSKGDKFLGSYWDQLTRDMMKVGAVTPFFKQEKFAENIKSLVNQGISFDLKQRAFLMTIQEKIANTFNVADGTLLRLIRIQQEDTTAGRLGMESALNSFLNEMYENTEYLKTVAEGVRSSLQEMEALMGGKAATEVEYQVQKWMGSLYSVGMSQEAVNAIAGALGQIAAGQIDGLTGSGAGNLLVMAANESGKSIAEILTKGLNADETNDLLQSTVNYLADIAEATQGNNVVQQQMASVFGVKASDLRAATNLRSSAKEGKNSIGDIHGENLKYNNMLNQLYKMAGSMYARTSIGEMMQNVWDNGQYTLASSMANNPISYLTYKIASLMDATVGGIPIPSLTVMMNGIDLETTVTDIMRLVAVGGGILGSLGSMISGLGNSFSGKAMLRKLGIEEGNGALKINTRGGAGLGAEPTEDGTQVSESGYIGNSDGNSIKDSTMQSAEDDKKKLMIKAKEEEPTNQIDTINTSVLKIYELLDDVAKGSKTLRVRVDNYGLTGDNKSTKSSQGGVNSLSGNASDILSDAGVSSSGTTNSTGSGFGGGGTSSTVTSLGGWTVG